MRILFLTHRLPYAPNRGDRIRAYHLLRLLVRHHEVHLVSLAHDDEELRHLGRMAAVAASARAAKVRWFRSHLGALPALAGSRPLTHALLSSPEFGAAIRAAVAEAPPDVILAFCTGIAYAAFEPPLAGIPCVLDMVDVDSEKWAELATRTGWPMKWIYRREARTLRRFERHAVERARATTVVSERERALAERVLGHAVTAVPVGVDVEAWNRPADAATAPEIVFCAVFSYAPNEEGAIWLASEVWPLVKRQVPYARLKLVGMSPSARVRALAADGSVEVTGAVADVRPHVWQSAAAVAPLWLSRGTQTKVLEALAAGVPCIVTPAVLEGLPATARSACLCRKDAAGFAEAIVACLLHPASATGRSAIRESVQALDWDLQLRPFLPILEEAVRPRSGSPVG
jgi:sugar transferase (PEP-CTERM/EpsH1 system associated)